MDEHFHQNSYISFLIQGSYCEENQAGAFIIQQGTVLFRPASYIHCHNLPFTTHYCFNIEFKKDWQHLAGIEGTLPSHLTIFRPGSFPLAYKLFGYFLQNFPLEFLEQQLLAWVAGLSGGSRNTYPAPWLQKAKAILENEYDTHHTLHSIAARVFVHPVYLANAFKKKTGSTIGEYQIRVKLEKALSLLLNTRLPIHEIAFQTGFYDSPHFVNSFKYAYRTSPEKFRSELKKLTGYNAAS